MTQRKYKLEREGTDQPKEHPVTKELAAPDMHWVRHCLSGEWVQEADWTPYCCSVQFERYFSM